MVKSRDSVKNQGIEASKVAAVIIFNARKQVLNLNKSRHIWPKELQLLTRLTDKQAKRLSLQYYH
jgi:hypothetical protein